MRSHVPDTSRPEPSLVAPGPALLLRVQDVCDQLNVSRATVQRLLAAGVLPSVKVGRARRVTYAALEQFVDDLAHGRVALDDSVLGGGSR